MGSFGKRLDGPGGHRQAVRRPVLLRAALHTLTASRAVTFFDVSSTGARMSMPEPLRAGQTIWLKIPPDEIFATVVWIGDGECGVRFEDPLEPWQFEAFQQRGKVVMVHGLAPDELLSAEDWATKTAR